MAYVASHPLMWLRRQSVGTGECVPLVQAATHAPLTHFWRRGARVEGDLAIATGTAIATFDPAGRYGDREDGSSHAAIYISQNKNGILVIDQWNIRLHGVIIRKQNPHERLIRYHNIGAKPVNSGADYYVVE